MQVARANKRTIVETKIANVKRPRKVAVHEKKNIWDLEALGHPEDFENPKIWLLEQSEAILEKDSSLNPTEVCNKLMDFYYEKYVSEVDKKGDSGVDKDDLYKNVHIDYSDLNLLVQPENKTVEIEKELEEVQSEAETTSLDIPTFYHPSPSDLFDLDTPIVNFFNDDEPLTETISFSTEMSPTKKIEPVFKVPELPAKRKNPEIIQELSPAAKRIYEVESSVVSSAPEESNEALEQTLSVSSNEVTLDQPMDNDVVLVDNCSEAKKGRGRPKGSKNKPKEERIVKQIKMEEGIAIKKKNAQQREKSEFTWVNMLTVGIINSPGETSVVRDLYQFIRHHFPSTAPTAEPGKTETWKNTMRHTLTEKKNGFIKNEVTAATKSSGNWLIDPSRREELIADCKAKANEFEHEVERLKMRHPEKLQDILDGNVGMPTNIEMYEFIGNTYKVKEEPKSIENKEKVIQQFQQERPWHQVEEQNTLTQAPIRQQQFQQIPEQIPWHQVEQNSVAPVQNRNQQFQQNPQPTPWYQAPSPAPPQIPIHQHQYPINPVYSNPTAPLQDQFSGFSNNQCPNQNWNNGYAQQGYSNFSPMAPGPSNQWQYQHNQPHPNYFSPPQGAVPMVAGPSNIQQFYGNQSQPNYVISEVATGDYGILPQEPTIDQQAFNEQQGQPEQNEQYQQNQIYTEMNDTMFIEEPFHDFDSPQPVLQPRAESIMPNNNINNNNFNNNNQF